MRTLVAAFAVAILLLTGTLAFCDTPRLRLSTTTSTENSGLLDILLPPFEEAEGVKVDVIAVGTGKALRLGEDGDVDLVFVHARPAEDKFVDAGYGVYRKDVMHNDFVIVGPKGDPAGLGKADTVNEAMVKLSYGQTPFISRGDDSGTHKKERALWKSAGVTPSGGWYAEAGQGMGAVLKICDEKGGYALTDRGTFIAFSGKVELVLLFEGDAPLLNPYGVIAVNPKRHHHVKFDLAKKFIDYLTGAKGQKFIGDYRVNGKQLFFPDAIPGS